MNRWMPWLLVPLWGCPAGNHSTPDCAEDADCDTQAGEFCALPTDATEDENGECMEEEPPPGAD